MSKSFSISIPATQGSLFEVIQKIGKKFGATIVGNATEGTFACTGYAGSYQVSCGDIKIAITQKPNWIPWFLIERRIKEYVTG